VGDDDVGDVDGSIVGDTDGDLVGVPVLPSMDGTELVDGCTLGLVEFSPLGRTLPDGKSVGIPLGE